MATQTLPIPLFTKLHRSVDGVQLSEQQEELIDCYFDEVDDQIACVRRPGLEEFVDLGLGTSMPVRGLFWWTDKGYAIAVSNGVTFKITRPGGVGTKASLGGTALSTGQPVSFATDGTNLYMASGSGPVLTTDGSAAVAALADAQAPTTVSHVAFLDGYILALKTGTNEIHYSDLNNGLSWSATKFSAVGSPDLLQALHVFRREIYLFGTESLEIWANDGVAPFSRNPGGFLNVGCIAKYSVVTSEEGIFWLDDKRHFSKYSVERHERISTPYDHEIEHYETVSDCTGYRVDHGGHSFFVWQFPSANKTLVYDYTTDKWFRWGMWNGTAADYDKFLGLSYAYSPDWGAHLMGSGTESVIHQFEQDIYQDDGSEIRLLARTGKVHYGTTRQKRCGEIRISAKRGTEVVTTPKAILRWRDDGGTWSNEEELSLGATGEMDSVLFCERTGIFRERQYELICSDSVPVVFAFPQHDLELLNR